MAKQMTITPNKTYATPANAVKAVEAKFPSAISSECANLRYIMMQTPEGRFFPLFIGNNSIMMGVHFHFNCAN
jgi:hypothetical protein